jgi:lipopolysaccharide transport system ATP-binding protein
MTVRLAFAVAAFLEPEILVVDEVLAVGDAEFQKKAIGKMQDISREGGRTVLFVSHNMAAVRSLCTRGILMEQGQIKFNGAIDEVIDLYLESASNENSLASYRNSTSQKSTYVSSIELFSAEGKVMNKAFLMGDRIQLKMFVKNNQVLKNLLSSVLIKTITGTRVCAIRTKEMLNERLVANGDFCLTIDNINENLMPGIYTLTFSLGNDSDTFEIIEDCMNFEIVANDVYNTSKIPKGNFVIFSKSSWTLSETNE